MKLTFHHLAASRVQRSSAKGCLRRGGDDCAERRSDDLGARALPQRYSRGPEQEGQLAVLLCLIWSTVRSYFTIHDLCNSSWSCRRSSLLLIFANGRTTLTVEPRVTMRYIESLDNKDSRVIETSPLFSLNPAWRPGFPSPFPERRRGTLALATNVSRAEEVNVTHESSAASGLDLLLISRRIAAEQSPDSNDACASGKGKHSQVGCSERVLRSTCDGRK